MKPLPIIAIILGSLAGLGSHLLIQGEESSRPQHDSVGGLRPVEHTGCVAANGVIEGARPEVALRPEVTGMLARVLVKENQEVQQGQLLAELNNESQKAQVALAESELVTARAERDRVKNGERLEKRRAAAALEEAKRAVFNKAENDWKRSERLAQARSASDEQRQGDYFRMLTAKSELEQASAERALTEAPARKDELEAAEGRISTAEARLRHAKAELAKTQLIAPTASRILQIYAEPGEMAMPSNTQPILLLADLSKRRARIFVEELDVAKVKPGQRGVVTADGMPGREFPGTVSVVLSRMGKRAPNSDAPGEYKDMYFREVLIDLDDGRELPINLRIQARVQTETEN